MNGREKAELQVLSGTRVVVELIDRLRTSFGFGNVVALTPIVEIKLRNGEIPARPLQLAIQSTENSGAIPLVVIIPIPFLAQPYSLAIRTTLQSDDPEELCRLEELRERVASFALDFPDNVEIGVKEAWSFLSTLPADGKFVLEDLIQPDEDDASLAGEGKDEELSRVDIADESGPRDTETCGTRYCCRICGQQLFVASQIEHFNTKETRCASIYVQEPPEYVSMKGSEQEGKVYCPKCKARVGSWCWSGSRCSCSEWVAPSFQFVLSKIDAKQGI